MHIEIKLRLFWKQFETLMGDSHSLNKVEEINRYLFNFSLILVPQTCLLY